jgi:hypothetical protein
LKPGALMALQSGRLMTGENLGKLIIGMSSGKLSAN